jgi:zinc transport system ATP-binding protein
MVGDDVLLEARGLCVSFDGRAVLDHVDVTVSGGEIVTLIGPNGSGKSTLVRAILGLLEPARGRVIARPGLRIGYTPQQLPVDPTLPLTVRRFLRLGARAPRARLQALLDEVGAGHLLDSQLANISGGERQRVVLARALLRQPDLLVLDEPMSGVDVAGQSELYRLIAEIRDRYRCGVLLVSHDIHLVMAATDTVVCLNHHVCCTGQPHAVVRDPAFVALFGREAAEVLAVYEHHHDHRHEATGEIVPIGVPPAGHQAVPRQRRGGDAASGRP